MLWLLLIALIGALPVQAQTALSAYLAVEGNLYSWTPGDPMLDTVSACDLDGYRVLRLALSPKGMHLALNVVTEDVFFGGYAPGPTGNIWLCDLTAGTITRLTDYRELSVGASAVAHWSPDGTRLAWGGINEGITAAELWLHDVTAGVTTRLVEDVPYDYGCGVGPYPPELAWSDDRLIVGYFIASEADVCLAEEIGFSIYTLAGERSDWPVPFSGEIGAVGTWYSGRDQVWFRLEGETVWSRLHLRDGSISAVSGVLHSTQPGGGTGRIQFDPLVVRLPGLDVTLQPETARLQAALSPDGRSALVITQATVFGVTDGRVTVLDVEKSDPEATRFLRQGLDIAWGTFQVEAAEPESDACPMLEILTYFIDQGWVVEGLGANNLRNAPLSAAPQIGQLQAGESFEPDRVGTLCSEGIRWRQVRAEGRLAWTAEAEGSTYYLQG